MTKIKPGIILLILLGVFLLLATACSRGKLKLLKINISPREVVAGEEAVISLSLKIEQRIERECFLFLHLEGFGPGRFLNADLFLARSAKYWQPGEKIDLGPFYVYIPPDLPAGDYRLTMGLAYARETPSGVEYVKIPYSNPGIGWAVGKLRVVKRPGVIRKDAGQDYLLTAENSLKRVFPETEYSAAAIRDEIKLSCARNEFEGFQVVIIALGSNLQDIAIRASDLVEEKTKAVIKSRHIGLFKVGFVKTGKPFYNTPRVGLWPDPLLPLRGNIRLEAGKIQPIWVNVYVPEDVLPGDYRGSITVKPKGLKPKEIKVHLRVWGFTLSQQGHLRSGFDFYDYLLDLRHPRAKGEKEAAYQSRLRGLRRQYYLDMLKHRINPIHNVGNPEFLGRQGGRYLLDFKEFDERVEFYRKFGQDSFGIAQEWPYGYTGEWTDKWYGFTDAQAAEGVFREYGNHLKEKGWLDRAYTYIFDETLHRAREFTALIHKGCPGIKNLVTMTPRQGYPDIDIWCVRVSNLEDPAVAQARRDGARIWMYVAGHTRPFPSLNLDLPSIEYRMIPWICWKYGAQGLLYWCVNWWQNTNPWDDPMTFPEQNGSGSLYYPDPQGREPIGSIRLEVLRDGFEDYEYLYLLEEKLRKLKDNPLGKEGLIKEIEGALSQASELVPSAAYFTRHPGKVNVLRDNLARLVERTYE